MVTANEARDLVNDADLTPQERTAILYLINTEAAATLPIFIGVRSADIAISVRAHLDTKLAECLNDVELLREPLLDWNYNVASASAATMAYDCRPETVVSWTASEVGVSIDDSITEYIGSIPGKGRYVRPQLANLKYYGTETAAVSEFGQHALSRVNNLLTRDDNPLLMQSGSSSSSSNNKRFSWTTHMSSLATDYQKLSSYMPPADQKRPDFVLMDEESKQRYATIEAKKPEVLAGVEDLVKAWKAGVLPNSTDDAGCPPGKAANVVSVLSQAAAYMSSCGHVYGCITTYEGTWVLQCTEGSTLRVSRKFKHTDSNPSTTEAMCWLTHMALTTNLRSDWGAHLIRISGNCVLRRSRTSSSDDVRRDPEPWRQQQESRASSRQGSRASSRQGSRASTPAGSGVAVGSKGSKGGNQQQGLAGAISCHESFSDDAGWSDVQGALDRNSSARKGIKLPVGLQICLGSILGAGVCGPVYKGWWWNDDEVTEVAVKGVMTPHQQELLQHEVEIYQQLQELQGVCIPKLLAYGPGLNGVGYFLVLQFLPGTRLSPSSHGGHPGIKEAAAAALRKVHAHSVLHDDVRHDNFIVQPGGQVWVIDFTHAKVSSPGGQQMQEMQAAELHNLAMLFVGGRNSS